MSRQGETGSDCSATRSIRALPTLIVDIVSTCQQGEGPGASQAAAFDASQLDTTAPMLLQPRIDQLQALSKDNPKHRIPTPCNSRAPRTEAKPHPHRAPACRSRSAPGLARIEKLMVASCLLRLSILSERRSSGRTWRNDRPAHAHARALHLDRTRIGKRNT